jgi:hypothetical protein
LFSASLGGTFVGAWAAFQLNIHESKKKIEDEQVVAANRALFALIAQLNMLSDIKRKQVDPFRNDPARFINMPALPPLEYRIPPLEIQSLGFLLETNSRQLLLTLLIEEQRFQDAIQAINLRSSLHLQSAQPLLSQAGIFPGAECTLSQLDEVLGFLLSASLTNATDNLICHIDSTCKSLDKAIKEAAAQLKSKFPYRDFLKVEISQAPISPDLVEGQYHRSTAG